MVDYREILRLNSLGCSQREISRAVHRSRNTVNEVLTLAEVLKIEWPLPEDVLNQDLEELLYPNKQNTETNYMTPDYEWIHKELARKGVTLTLLWTEYCADAHAAGMTPYMSTQFGDLYRKWARASKATMRITRKPGDYFEVDWAGGTLTVYDQVTGKPTEYYLFVGVLGCSDLVYAELCRDMTSENFILCHVHAYEYFGGVTRLLRVDNLKAGVTTNTRYETVIPKAYREMAEYYDTAIVPARVRHPDDKPDAEGGVSFATTWILAALRNEHFFTFDEAHAAVALKMEKLNNEPFKKRPGCRRTAYENEEREFMQPLPARPFESAVWKTAKVPRDYTITDGLNRYSVPYDLIGEYVDIRVTRDRVDVFYRENQVASHVRLPAAQRDAVILKEHMPEKHRKYLEYNADSFIAWGDKSGPSISKVIHSFLESGKQPEQGFKYCVSLMNAGNRYGIKRLENACERVLMFSAAPSLRNIITILKNGQDKAPASQTSVTHSQNGEDIQSSKPLKHGITRGVDAFRKGDETE